MTVFVQVSLAFGTYGFHWMGSYCACLGPRAPSFPPSPPMSADPFMHPGQWLASLESVSCLCVSHLTILLTGHGHRMHLDRLDALLEGLTTQLLFSRANKQATIINHVLPRTTIPGDHDGLQGLWQRPGFVFV